MNAAFLNRSELNTSEPLLTRKDVGRLLCLHPGSVKRLEHRGVLKAIKINARVTRYLRSEVEKLIEEART